MLRAGVLPLIAKILLAGILFVTLYNVVTFSESTHAAVNRSFSDNADVNLYGLIDDLHDPDAFRSFRDSLPDLERLGAFYNQLSNDDELTFLSSFDQPLPIRDFPGDGSFEDGYGTGMSTRGPYTDEETGRTMVDVKSLQMNRNAFEFYKLRTSTGDTPDWETIDYEASVTPVVLGSDFEGVYEVGDTFVGTLYFAEMTFEVAGFLAPHSSIFYHDDINFFLDTSVVIPYPEQLRGFTEANKDFSGILSFAMVNGDIAASKNLATDEVLDRLASIASSTGFENYALLNVSPYLTQFTLTKKIIQSNLGLVVAIEGALVAGVLFAIFLLNRFLFARESNRYRIAWIAGTSRQRIFLTSLPSVLVAHGGIGAVVATAYLMYPQHSEAALRPVLLAFAAFVLLDLGQHGRLLATLIRTESGERR